MPRLTVLAVGCATAGVDDVSDGYRLEDAVVQG